VDECMMEDIFDEGVRHGCPTTSSSRRVPWNSASSKWQSCFGIPLAHTSLRAYLSPEQEKKLKEKAPYEELEDQYYNEAIKFSYIQGAFDSHDIEFHVRVPRRAHQELDHVKDVIRHNDMLDPASRQVRKKVKGCRNTRSSVDHSILAHPESANIHNGKMPTAAGSTGRWKVSGKIGARPGRKDKVDVLKAWMTTDLSAITPSASNQETDIPASTQTARSEVTKPDVYSKTGPQSRSWSRPLQLAKQGLPWRSGIMSQPAGAAAPLPKAGDGKAEILTLGTCTQLKRSPMEARLKAYAEQVKAEALAENPKLEQTLDPPPRKRGVAAYMPLVSPKCRLMDRVEKVLFGTCIKAPRLAAPKCWN